MNIVDIVKSLPKTDLHCHLDGSIRPDTIWELCKKDNIELPVQNPKDLLQYVQVGNSCSSLKDYLTKFEIPLLLFNNPRYIYRITLELLEDCKEQGIRYMEIRFAPFLAFPQSTISANERIQAILLAMKHATEKFGIYSGLILCAMRHEPVENALEVIELAKRYMSYGVVGVDLAGNEHDFPPEIHKKAFDIAYGYGLNITIHAGETGISENITKSIQLLHAKRIGHGTFAFKDEKIVEYLHENKIPLEVCIKSNIHTKAVTSYETHPVKYFLQSGLKVTINTDNTTVSNVTLMEEYEQLIYMGFSLRDILKIIVNGIEASFAPQHIKDKLISELSENSPVANFKYVI